MSKSKVNSKKALSANKLRVNTNDSFKKVLTKLNIDEFYTKADKKQRYNKFITAVVPEENFNYMSDLIEMPRTSKGYKWLLVVLDLGTNKFDMEPMKNKEAKTTLDAFKSIIDRGILSLPEISIKTDGGTEFKGVFHKYLENHGIMHKTGMPYRKNQMGPVEGLNRILARILMTYLNDKSVEKGKDYYNWDDILDEVRKEVNMYRERDLGRLKEYQNEHYFDPEEAGDPEYKIGDYVHWKLDRPTDMLGKSINDSKFRMGDRRFSIETRQIVDVLYYPSKPYYRYKLQYLPHVSYSAAELKPSKKTDDYYIVKKIIDVKTVGKKKYYLCWWSKTLKKDSTWEEADRLIEDGLSDMINQFLEERKKKK